MMIYNFKINNDIIFIDKPCTPKSGNVNSYICKFDIACDVPDLSWFCVFKKGNITYSQPIIDNECVIPYEILQTEGIAYIGAYGTNSSDTNLIRVSTSMLRLDVDEGAYREAVAPLPPQLDAWEEFVNSKVQPVIDSIPQKIEEEVAKIPVIKGDDGYTPVKGKDYYTDEETKAVSRQITETLSEQYGKIEDKVDKIDGKDLSTNDYTNAEKQKLNDLHNYDDTEIKQSIQGISTDIDGINNDINNINNDIGDIDNALDIIISIQNTLIGGDA